MSRYLLTFRIDFFPEWEGYKKFDKSVRYTLDKTAAELARQELERQNRQALYNSIGLKLFSYAWAEAWLDEAMASKIIQLAKHLQEKKIGYLGSGILQEVLTPEEFEACEWFIISPAAFPGDNDFNIHDLYPQCKAYQYSPLIHFLRPHYTSEKCKSMVEQNNLSGIQFLWAKDVGKYKSSQWYSAFATESLGHGVDHVWFDRKRYTENITKKIDGPEAKFETWPAQQLWDAIKDQVKDGMKDEILGRNLTSKKSFDNRYFRNDWATDIRSVDELLSLFPKNKALDLSFGPIPRFQRKYIPSTDFAYIWRSNDWKDKEGKILRSREVCCNRKTKDILLNNNMISNAEFIGILLCDNLPPGVPDLDAGINPPPPLYTAEELILLRQIEKDLLAKFNKEVRPARNPDIKRSLRLLRKVKSIRPNDFHSGLSQRKYDTVSKEFPFVLPENWIAALRISDGGIWSVGNYEFHCKIRPARELVSFNLEIIKDRKANDEDYVDEYIYIGSNDFGDLFALSKIVCPQDKDCHVVLISYEDFSLKHQWVSIADFLESVLLSL